MSPIAHGETAMIYPETRPYSLESSQEEESNNEEGDNNNTSKHNESKDTES